MTARALVITVSTSAAAGTQPDSSGPALVAGLGELGLVVDGPIVVADGDPVGAALRSAVAAGYDLAITTGGTGISPSDRTPEQSDRVIDTPLPGIPEALRSAGIAAGVATAMLSRGRAGLAGRTLVINLPGSRGAIKDALAVLTPVLAHAIDQIGGGAHPGQART